MVPSARRAAAANRGSTWTGLCLVKWRVARSLKAASSTSVKSGYSCQRQSYNSTDALQRGHSICHSFQTPVALQERWIPLEKFDHPAQKSVEERRLDSTLLVSTSAITTSRMRAISSLTPGKSIFPLLNSIKNILQARSDIVWSCFASRYNRASSSLISSTWSWFISCIVKKS